MHTVSIIVCYLAIIVAYALIMRLNKRIVKVKECQKSGQAIKPSKTEHLLTGQTSEIFLNGSATRFDPPILFDKPHEIQGD